MKKAFLIFFFTQFFFAQQNNQLWKGYFSYNEIVDIESTPNALFAATENAVFKQEVASANLNIFNSISGCFLATLPVECLYSQ